MNRKKSILFFIGSPAIFCFSLSRQALSNKHTVAVRRKSNRRKYDRPKHSTPTRRSGNTCRSIIPEPHPTVVRIRHTPGRTDMIRAGNNICRPFRHGNTVFVTAKRPASHRKTEPQNRGGRTGRTRLMFSVWRSCTKRVRHGLPKHESGNTPTPESPTEQTAPQQPLPAYPFPKRKRRPHECAGGAVNPRSIARHHIRLPVVTVSDCWIWRSPSHRPEPYRVSDRNI